MLKLRGQGPQSAGLAGGLAGGSWGEASAPPSFTADPIATPPGTPLPAPSRSLRFGVLKRKSSHGQTQSPTLTHNARELPEVKTLGSLAELGRDVTRGGRLSWRGAGWEAPTHGARLCDANMSAESAGGGGATLNTQALRPALWSPGHLPAAFVSLQRAGPDGPGALERSLGGQTGRRPALPKVKVRVLRGLGPRTRDSEGVRGSASCLRVLCTSSQGCLRVGWAPAAGWSEEDAPCLAPPWACACGFSPAPQRVPPFLVRCLCGWRRLCGVRGCGSWAHSELRVAVRGVDALWKGLRVFLGLRRTPRCSPAG